LFQGHLLLSAVLFTAMFAAYTYVAAFLETVAGFNGREVAFTLIGFGIAGLAGNWIAGRVVDREPIATTAWVAFVLVLTTGAVSLVGGNFALLIPLLGVWGAAHNAAFVACQVRVMVAGARARAFALSLNISACNLGIAAGSITGGAVVRHFGVGAIGYLSAVLSVCALFIALVLRNRTPAMARSSGGDSRTRDFV
jgi:predicted MFS family arabinose efflux permease